MQSIFNLCKYGYSEKILVYFISFLIDLELELRSDVVGDLKIVGRWVESSSA
jgi:hypothetical protein